MTKRKSLKLSTPTEVRRALSKIANLVLNNELDAKTANCIITACNAILSGIRMDDHQKKLEELEQVLQELKNKRE